MMDRRIMLGSLGGALMAPASALGATRDVTTDRFDAPGGGSHPALVLLYGSDGLTNAGRYETAAKMLAAAGYTVFLPHYFEATDDRRANYREIAAKFAIWQDAILRTVSAVAKQPGIDQARLGIVGFSLGGALALTASSEDRRIRAVINFFGFLPESLAAAKRVAPTLTLHGDADRIVPVSNAMQIENVLRRLRVPVETRIYPGEGHGLSAAAFLDAATRSTRFLSEHL